MDIKELKKFNEKINDEYRKLYDATIDKIVEIIKERSEIIFEKYQPSFENQSDDCMDIDFCYIKSLYTNEDGKVIVFYNNGYDSDGEMEFEKCAVNAFELLDCIIQELSEE